VPRSRREHKKGLLEEPYKRRRTDVAFFYVLTSLFKAAKSFTFFVPHAPSLSDGPLVVVAEEVKDAVDQKKENFILEAIPSFFASREAVSIEITTSPRT